MSALIRSMIFSGLRARFPNFREMIIYPIDKKVVVSFDDGTLRNFPTGNTDEKYFKMLAEAKEMKEVNSIYVSKEKDVILIRGDKDVML